MIVVDTNVIASLWMPNDKEEVIYELLKKDKEWIAPTLWKAEFRSVVTLYLRKGYLALSAALEALQEAENLMKHTTYEVPSFQIMQKVCDSNCSAYDCEFVALADDLDIKLITFDKKVLSNFPNIALNPEKFI